MRLIDADFAEDLILMHEQNAKAFGKIEYAKGIRTAYADVSACCRTIKDAVIVVRCKDCRFKKQCQIRKTCGFIDSDYCSFGERKNDED